MRFLASAILLFAILAMVTVVHAAESDGNGVERGDLNIQPNASIPKGLEDTIETTIFENCDLRGATKITTAFLQTSPGGYSYVTQYTIQYRIDFSDGRSSLITVKAEIRLGSVGQEGTATVSSFSGPLCRSIP